jgi:hypothetical protein
LLRRFALSAEPPMPTLPAAAAAAAFTPFMTLPPRASITPVSVLYFCRFCLQRHYFHYFLRYFHIIAAFMPFRLFLISAIFQIRRYFIISITPLFHFGQMLSDFLHFHDAAIAFIFTFSAFIFASFYADFLSFSFISH